MLQNVLENENERMDKTLSPGSLLKEGNNSNSLYKIPLLIIVGLALKDYDKNKDMNPGIAIDEQYKEEIQSLLLETRPAVVESVDTTKSFAGRFGATGYNSRGGRGAQRGRAYSGQIGGGGRRSIIRQTNENLWDMPCSEMSNMTLGDIREAENKMKAEDLTLDQFVERQKESNEKKSVLHSQSNQKKNFVSIPISGEATINISNTFSLNNSVKNYQNQISSNASGNIQYSSNQLNHQQQQQQQQQQQNKDNFFRKFTQNGVLESHHNLSNYQNSTVHDVNSPANLRNDLVGNEKTNSTLFPKVNGNRKSSSISEAFLNGPANLSLFDVNTPIFDDDNNETVIDFRPPTVNNPNIIKNSFEEKRMNKNISEQLIGGQAHFEQGIQSSVSNFSWSNRNSSNEEIDKNINCISEHSTSFPALLKNSQFNQSQVKMQNNRSSMPSEPNIIQKLQAAGIASKIAEKNIIDNVDHNSNHSGFFESKFKQNNSITNEYPPLSSASNITAPSLSSPNSNNLRFNNQLKSNDAGRLLMSIIGAGQQNNNNNRNFTSNFNIRNNNHRINSHSTHSTHNRNHNNNGSHHNGQIGNFVRY